MRYITQLILLTIVLSGCITTPKKPIDTGTTPVELKQAANDQYKSLVDIRNNTTEIITSTQEDKTKKHATKILNALPAVEYGNKVLQHEAKGKKEIVANVRDLEQKVQHYEVGDNKFMRHMLLLLKIAGGIMIPVGLFLMSRGILIGIWVSVLGVFSIILSTIIAYVEHNGLWIAAAISAVALVPVIKTFFSQNKALGEAVKVAETLKHELLSHAPEVVQDLFGKEHTPGKIVQDETTKKIIRGQRKLIAEEWKPVVPTHEPTEYYKE